MPIYPQFQGDNDSLMQGLILTKYPPAMVATYIVIEALLTMVSKTRSHDDVHQE
ncbi:hypothetical protein D3C85_1814020 [compost metagenome]